MSLKLTFSGMFMNLLPTMYFKQFFVLFVFCFQHELVSCLISSFVFACNSIQYNFEGRYDLVKFMKTIQKAGLYANLRIGPYVCAEWNFGYLGFIYYYFFLRLCCELIVIMSSFCLQRISGLVEVCSRHKLQNRQ